MGAKVGCYVLFGATPRTLRGGASSTPRCLAMYKRVRRCGLVLRVPITVPGTPLFATPYPVHVCVCVCARVCPFLSLSLSRQKKFDPLNHDPRESRRVHLFSVGLVG